MRRSRLRHQSRRRTAETDIWRDVLMVVNARDHGWCRAERLVPEVGCRGPTDPHHVIPVGRAPWLRLDPDNVITVCRAHHDWIGDHPTAATDRGLLGSAYR
jgi:hypothetical protein